MELPFQSREKAPMSFPPGWGDDTLSEHMNDAIHNAFSTFTHNKSQYEHLASLDRSLLTICSNLSNSQIPRPSTLLMIRAHSGYRAACRLVISGQITESVPILRAGLECSLYALHISKNKTALEIWNKYYDDDSLPKSLSREFTMKKLKSTLHAVGPQWVPLVDTLYQLTIDSGAHPNPMAIKFNLTRALSDGRFTIRTQTLHGNSETKETGMEFAITTGLVYLLIFGKISPELFKIHKMDSTIMKILKALSN